MIAIVNFRTLANGSYRYMAGKRRGYWRVLLVRDVNGPTCIHAHNVVSKIYEGPAGIDGVTERSSYCIQGSAAEARRIACEHNAERLGAAIADNAFAMGMKDDEQQPE